MTTNRTWRNLSKPGVESTQTYRYAHDPLLPGYSDVGRSIAERRFADRLRRLPGQNVHEVYTIAGITGLLSAVIDNVPLVAACMGMYPVVDTAALASSLDPVYMQAFVQDGIFWHLLTFCAGVGGSLLIIGSAAGVVAMGLEKIEFGWYLRKITLLALAGYFAGMLVIFLEHLLLG